MSVRKVTQVCRLVVTTTARSAWRTPFGEMAVSTALVLPLAWEMRQIGGAAAWWILLGALYPVVLNVAFDVYRVLRLRQSEKQRRVTAAMIRDLVQSTRRDARRQEIERQMRRGDR